MHVAQEQLKIENIAVVAESVEENPDLCIPRRSLELGIPQTSLHHILHKDLGIKAYKVQLTQDQRRVFADWVVEMLENGSEFHRKIIMSDNKQNCQIWGSENLKVIVEKPLYPQSVTVWCSLWFGGVIG